VNAVHRPIIACELRRNLAAVAIAAILAPAATYAQAAAAAPQGEHAGSAATHEGQAAESHGEEAAHGGGLSGLLWPIANFIVLAGILYRYGRQPAAEYFAARKAQVRKDLVEAAELKSVATAQLAELEKKMQALPGELDALRARGRTEIAAEEQRIAAAAAAERTRLLEQTRREIDLQVRTAKRDLLEHAADLAVQLAGQRIERDITPADQDRLVRRYIDQVKPH
jgi:F-type H+-transporting ATPase subunit b